MNRYVRAAGAAAVLLVLLAGIPGLLVAMFANPLPGWADVYAGDVSDGALLDVLATIAWLGWVQFAIAVARETLAHFRLAPRPRIAGRLPSQRLARALVTTVFLVGPTAAPVFAAPHASAATAVAPATAADFPHRVTASSALEQPSAASSPRGTPAGAPIPGTRSLIIGAAGPFTFWELAQHYLGDGERWREVWDLNQGRTQPDGTTMTEPHWLHPGWSVLIPETASAPQPEHPAPALGIGTEGTARRDSVAASNPMTVFGLGSGAGLLAGVILSELLRRRHTQSRHRRPGRVPASTPSELAATERKLLLHGPHGQQNAFALDRALRALARDLAHTTAPPPDVTAVRISAETIDLNLSTDPPPGTCPPRPWQVDPRTHRWSVRLELVARPDRPLRETQVPLYPALVSIGTSTDQASRRRAPRTTGSWIWRPSRY